MTARNPLYRPILCFALAEYVYNKFKAVMDEVF